MKLTHRLSTAGAPLAALAIAATTAMGGTETTTTVAAAPAGESTSPVKLSGYASLAYTYTDNGTETFADGNTPFDTIKVGFEGDYGPFGAYASLFYTPGVAGDDGGILDAYATYTTGDVTITAGKYLSYLGYEAFDTVNMTQITYANTLGAIPGYHTGIKIDYGTDTFGAGFSVSDSIRMDNGFWSGDDDFSDDQGYEAYVVYKGIDKLTLWAGFAYENTDDAGLDEFITYDLWASYELTEKITIAGEVAYHDSGPRGVQGLAFLQYAFTDKFSTVFRFGIDEFAVGGDDNYRYTISPTYAFTDYFLVRAEVSYNDSKEDSVFSGIQAVAKF